ncbi:MAG: hypothetical protein ACLTZY_08010 [Alistipes indistinctus]
MSGASRLRSGEFDCSGRSRLAGQRDHIDVVCSYCLHTKTSEFVETACEAALRIDEEFAVACAGVGIEGNLQFVLLPFNKEPPQWRPC